MACLRTWSGRQSVKSPEEDLENLEWKGLASRRLSEAWEGEEDELCDYL
jgi:hypothetical protein